MSTPGTSPAGGGAEDRRPGAPGPVAVLGVGPSPLGASERRWVDEAVLVVGAARHLAALGLAPGRSGGRRVLELGGDLEPALAAIEAAGGPVAVLASGDPGFFGIVRALAERVGRRRLEVVPGVSSVAVAFARAGLPWDDALVVSAHGRDPRAAVNACLAHPKVAVLTGPGLGPAELARALAGSGRRLLVAERLGEPDERVVEGTPAQIAAAAWADPNVVVAFDEARAIGAKGHRWPGGPGPEGWALPDGAFAYRRGAADPERPWAGMVTKAEVRALALARLAPGVGDLVWDVGAGSGAVAVECARLGAATIAVERDPEACALVTANAARHGVRLQVVRGTAPAALEALPDPDAAFVGGSGGALAAVCKLLAARARRAVVVALAGIERVVPAAELLVEGGMEVETTLVQAARLDGVAGLHRLVPTNPVFLVCGVRR